jgi:hypothetical protein
LPERAVIGLILAELPLAKVGRRIARHLAEHFNQWVEGEVLADAVYSDESDGGPLCAKKSISATINRIVRPLLALEGLRIESNTGVGYRMCWAADGDQIFPQNTVALFRYAEAAE